jgi:5'-deoxynucleotidase YfbR-like HD superfamily hydrolase
MINQKVINNIANTKRFSNSFLFVEENIGTHSNEMALLCINFSKIVDKSSKEVMCYKCTIHDLEETVTYDVPRPFKYARPEMKRLISEVSNEIFEPMLSPDLFEDFKSAKGSHDIDSYLVAIADRMQCYLKMKREVVTYGNKMLEGDFYNFKNELEHHYFKTVGTSKLMDDESRKNLLIYLKSLI